MITQPERYLMCQNTACSQAKNCLHQIAYENLDQYTEYVEVLNPKLFSGTEKCKYFKSSVKVKVAWGIKNLLTSLPYSIAKEMRKMLISHFTKAKYYRFYRGELPIYPADQKIIENAFKKYNITSEPEYDRFSEEYDW